MRRSRTPEGIAEAMIEFLPVRRPARHWITIAAALTMTMAAASLVAWIVLKSTRSTSDLWAIVGFSALAVLFAVTGVRMLRSAPFSVHNGLITLPWSLRTKGGARTRIVRVDEIVSMERVTGPGGHVGAMVRLRDGTAFQVWDADLPAGGLDCLLRLRTLDETW